MYESWAQFAAGYVLGRCLHFDDEKFGSRYADMATVHQLLRSEPESPWLTVPWSPPESDGPHGS